MRIEAYDLGLPTPLSSDLDLSIYVRNVNHYKPRFAQSSMFANFTEHSKPGDEFVILPPVIERDEVDILDDPAIPVCYFIIQGNHKGFFDLERSSHRYLHKTHYLLIHYNVIIIMILDFLWPKR